MKNRQRWTFGGLYPRGYCSTPGDPDNWYTQTEGLVEGNGRASVHGSVRFLHVMTRRVAELTSPSSETPDLACAEHRFVESLQVGEKLYQKWQEAVEREVPLDPSDLAGLTERSQRLSFAFAPRREMEPVCDATGMVRAVLVREQEEVAGTVELSAELVAEGLYRLTVRIENSTGWRPSCDSTRDEALLRSLVSTHTILGVRGGAFVSLFDPPEAWRSQTAACRNVGTWPVLVGAEGERDTLLSSPIILYDYPQVAPESPGDLFDATEIDEILTLRIRSLTEDEKRLMASVDERARLLLQRTQALSGDELLALHGTVRMYRTDQHDWNPMIEKPRPDGVRVGGVELRRGDRVRLWPRGRADIFDMVLEGMTATIESIEQDYEDRTYLAVTLDDDPGQDLGELRKIGHRFFFGVEEVEPLGGRHEGTG